MSNTFLYRMPAGVAGAINSAEHATIEAGIFDADYPCLAFGILVKLVSGKYRPIASGDTLANVAQGFLARPYPVSEPLGTTDQSIGAGIPNAADAANVMKRGYMNVVVTANGGTALADIVKGDKVYVRVTAASPGDVGDIEAGSAEGNEVVPGAFFTGAPDSDGLGEIAYNI